MDRNLDLKSEYEAL
jgi:hypothetical protein